jgi:hypothetical protein
MPARTYATDVYLTCPCTECEGREVRISCGSSAISHGSPLQPAIKPYTSSYRKAKTRRGRHQAAWSAAAAERRRR